MNIDINILYSHSMNLTDFITTDYKAFHLENSIAEVKLFFNDLSFTHFPVVENEKLLGMLAESDLKNLTDNERQIASIQHLFTFYKTTIPDNYLDLISLFAKNDTDIVPIVDLEDNYLGYFELNDILHLFSNSPFLSQSSTTLIIEKEANSYSMSEIAQIIATNNIPLLGMYLSDATNNRIQITLRVAAENVNEVIQSLRRYEYHIVTQNTDDLHLEELKDRSNYLHKYLSM